MSDNEQPVQLVDEQDNPLGTMNKMEAHRLPALHRAVSVLVFNSAGDWLLHRRAAGKYHSACLWTNACCTHPFPGETYAAAARRRLQEEMGMDAGEELLHLFDFVYRAKVNDELTEYEYDRVFTLTSDALPQPHHLYPAGVGEAVQPLHGERPGTLTPVEPDWCPPPEEL